MKTVVVAGATSQAGIALCNYLNDKNVRIVATVRNSNNPFLSEIEESIDDLKIFDLHDSYSINSIISGEKPDYFFNCAAASFVGSSNSYPNLHFESNLHSVLYQLEAIKNNCPECRYVNFGSSEEFGETKETPQSEKTLFSPCNFYGVSKVCSRLYVEMYRRVYGLYAIQNWSYNFESKYRSESFVVKKIAKSLKKIKKAISEGKEIKPLYVGNIFSSRDFSHVDDVVEAYWLSANQPEPRDYIISSGKKVTIKNLISKFLEKLDIDYFYCGSNSKQKPTKDQDIPIYYWNNIPIVYSSSKFYRENDPAKLCGDNSLAIQNLGWNPKKTIDDIIQDMLS